VGEYRPDVPPPPGSRRPGVITAAGVLLVVAGALGVIYGLFLLGGGGRFLVFGLIALPVAGLELYAGVQVLGLKEAGRQVGLILAVIAAVLDLLSIGRGSGGLIVSFGINVFIIFALTQYKDAFSG
jgi:hypothetical protein